MSVFIMGICVVEWVVINVDYVDVVVCVVNIGMLMFGKNGCWIKLFLILSYELNVNLVGSFVGWVFGLNSG